MAVTAVAAIAGAVIGGYKLIKGASDKKKAQRERDRLSKPFYQIQEEYYKNQQLAQGLAGQGYTTSAKNYLTEESQRGFGSGVNAIEATGGSANDISKLYSVYQNSIRNTAAGDSQQQIENIKNLMAANKDIAGQKTTKWSLDQDRTYQNKYKELSQTQAIADQNMWNGASEAVGSIGALGTSLSNSNLIPKSQAGAPLERSAINTAPAALETSQQPIQPTMQQRSSPDVTQQAASWNNVFGQDYF